MAMTASAWGFSGFDPLGSFGAGLNDLGFSAANSFATSAISNLFNKKSAKNSLKNAIAAYNYQQLNGPSLYRQGLEKAGYNPLLAVGAGFGGNVGNVGSVAPASGSIGHASSGEGGFDAETFFSSKQAKRLVDAEVKAAEAEADTAQSNADIASSQAGAIEKNSALEAFKASLEYEALSDTRTWSGKEPPNNPTGDLYRDMIRNSVERSAYTNSKDHAIAEDTINAIHGGSSAMSGYQALQTARQIGDIIQSRRERRARNKKSR